MKSRGMQPAFSLLAYSGADSRAGGTLLDIGFLLCVCCVKCICFFDFSSLGIYSLSSKLS